MLSLSPTRKVQLAAALQDSELADVLEQMTEPDQIRFLAGLGVERVADVVEEMEPDDAADLLAEMSAEEREHLLAEMENVRAADLRRLLRYGSATAGGLMTSQPLIVDARTPRWPRCWPGSGPRRWPMTAAAQVYVCEPPAITPDRPLPGQLRLPAAAATAADGDRVAECIEESTFVRPELPDHQVAVRMAAYDLVGVAVCDPEGHLLGAITVDDVLDRLLPADWRREDAREA